MQADDGVVSVSLSQERVEQAVRGAAGFDVKKGPSSHAVATMPGLGRSCQEAR